MEGKTMHGDEKVMVGLLLAILLAGVLVIRFRKGWIFQSIG
jgi:hypothetical protein